MRFGTIAAHGEKVYEVAFNVSNWGGNTKSSTKSFNRGRKQRHEANINTKKYLGDYGIHKRVSPSLDLFWFVK